MMTAYFEHESLVALQAACTYITNSCLAEPGSRITAHEASPGVAVVRHPNRALVMAVIGRMADTDHNTLVGVEWTEVTDSPSRAD